MRTTNYIDITKDYWETENLTSKLNAADETHKFAFACILSGLEWRAAWWGAVKDGSAVFNNMSKGVVYIPAFYTSGKLTPAAYPIAVGYQHELELKPNLKKRISIVLKEQDRYLAFQPGRKYALYYWDNKWKPLSNQLASAECML